jgi:hypothetical protein
LERLETVGCFIFIWKCAYCRDRRIQLFTYLNYGGSKRGGECEIACAHALLLVDGQLERLETLFSALLPSVNVHIARMDGTTYFSELWWIQRGEGCKIAGAHFS